MSQLSKAESDRLVSIATNIASELGISICQLSSIIGLSAAELSNQTVETELSGHTLVRISYLIRIYKALHQLFTEPSQANAWLLRNNGHFNNRTALEVINEAPDTNLKTVAEYLEYQLT